MGNIFLTSDCHFNHENILKYEDSRGFNSIEEMNEKIIENWNSVVQDEDLVYILGDMFMGSLEGIDEIMPRLKGRKYLVIGNHDTRPRVEKMAQYLEGYSEMITIRIPKKRRATLCHYPMREWYNKDNGSYHFYGHVHGNEHRGGLNLEKGSFHVGMDTNNLTPITLEYAIEQAKED